MEMYGSSELRTLLDLHAWIVLVIYGTHVFRASTCNFTRATSALICLNGILILEQVFLVLIVTNE